MTKLTARQRAKATYGMGGYYLGRGNSSEALIVLPFRGTMAAVWALETAFVGGRL